jgi:hypothetical protein
LEAAGAHERVGDGREVVSVPVESGAHGLEVAERCQERERPWQHALAFEQLEQAPGA